MAESKSLRNLKIIFQDYPEVLKLLDLRELDADNLEGQYLTQEMRERELYSQSVNFYATGRTGAGKTSLGNCLLDSKSITMESHGHIDCTSVVQHFKMKSNLQYFDLPGSGSNELFENINRAALLIPQIKDEDEGIIPTNILIVKDFTHYAQTQKYEEIKFSVAEWQSDKTQHVYEADIILYVVSPHMQFIRSDRKYLRALLKSRKGKNGSSKVIFAMNVHENPDGTAKATAQQVEDCQNTISEVYEQFYPGSNPRIFKVNSLRGDGIVDITKAICQILPREKIGKMSQVLSDELKGLASEEQKRRYRQALIYIAGRLATYKVDTDFGKKSLLQEAYAAVCSYGISVFQEPAIFSDIEDSVYNAVDEFAAKAKTSRTEAIKILVQSVRQERVEREVTDYVPDYQDEEIVEERPEYAVKTKKVKVSASDRALLGTAEIAAHIAASPVSIVQGVGSLFGLVEEEDILSSQIHKNFDDMAYKDEQVLETSIRKLVRTEQRFKGMKEQKRTIVERIPVVFNKEQETGQSDYLQGGYPVISDILAIGLGLEETVHSEGLANSIESIMAAGQIKVTAQLGRYTEDINRLVTDKKPEEAEKEIVSLLETIFLS